MKTIRNTTAAIFLTTLGHAAAAPVVVESWADITVADGTTFLLSDSSGASFGSVELAIEEGVTSQAFSTARSLDQDYWSAEPPVVDLMGDSSVQALSTRVVPSNGVASYDLQFSLNSSTPFVLMIGELFGDASSETGPIVFDAGEGTVSFLGSQGWADGLNSFITPLNWDGTASQLVRAPLSAEGEDSELAFFLVSPGSANPQLTLRIPSGYGEGLGDSLTFGVGVIPEPSALLLLATLGGVFLRRAR